jgi:hypothetical protein
MAFHHRFWYARSGPWVLGWSILTGSYQLGRFLGGEKIHKPLFSENLAKILWDFTYLCWNIPKVRQGISRVSLDWDTFLYEHPQPRRPNIYSMTTLFKVSTNPRAPHGGPRAVECYLIFVPQAKGVSSLVACVINIRRFFEWKGLMFLFRVIVCFSITVAGLVLYAHIASAELRGPDSLLPF